MSATLVLDTGSTSVRAALVEDGAVVSVSSVVPRLVDSPDALAGKEWKPDELWEAACSAIRALKATRRPDCVVATAQRLAVVFLDASGKALYAGPNSDARGLLESVELMREHGKTLYEITGHQPQIILVPARVEWMRRHRPQVADSIATVMSLADWFAFRLSGEVASEPSLAGDTGLFDVRRRTWAREVSEWGVDPAWLPPLREPGELLGKVGKRAAADTGLPEGTPVAVGCGDTMAGLLGMRVASPGCVGVVAGSTMPVMRVEDEPPVDPIGRCWAGSHVAPGLWLREVNGGEAGIAQAWLAGLMSVRPEELHALAAESTPAGVGPALLGPAPLDFSDMPLAMTGGIALSLPVGVLGPDKGGIARAFVENLAFAIRRSLEWLGSPDVAAIDLGGGLSESALFSRILATVVGKPVRAHGIGVTAVGASLCATTALGGAANPIEASSALARECATHQPDPASSGTYEHGYGLWAAAHDRALADAVRISSMI